jgi:hypothetical protein
MLKKMTPAEYKRYLEQKHCIFFLSELNTINEYELALIIELMRASEHIKNFRHLMSMMSSGSDAQPNDEEFDEEVNRQLEVEGPLTMVLNMSAAQFREALQIFRAFSETSFFKTIHSKVQGDDLIEIDLLLRLNSEFKEKRGLVYDVLYPLRNLVFHYHTEKQKNSAVDWIRRCKELELQRKPNYQNLDLDDFDFSTGLDFDRTIYSDYLFHGRDRIGGMFEWQKLIWTSQIAFIRATRTIIKEMLSIEGIPPRNINWATQYSRGYIKEKSKRKGS